MRYEGERMITEAIASVSAATGLQFVYDGLAEEDPSDRRVLVQEELYGDRSAPIEIARVTPEEESEVAGGTIGLDGSSFGLVKRLSDGVHQQRDDAECTSD